MCLIKSQTHMAETLKTTSYKNLKRMYAKDSVLLRSNN